MTKIVNLDDLAAAPRVLKFKGNEHKVEDLPLEKFIQFQADFDALLAAQEGNDAATVLKTATAIIGMCVPTFNQVQELNIRQLMACVQLIAEIYPAPEDSASSTASAEGND